MTGCSASWLLLMISVTSFSQPHGLSDPRIMSLNHQSEESHSVTVEWRFSSTTNNSVPSLKIHCVQSADVKVFYHLANGVEESQHEFAGRVQCDKDALGAELVRLHLSRVGPDNSGVFLCRMASSSGRKVKEFSLNIMAGVDRSKRVRPNPAVAVTDGSASLLGLTTAAETVAVLIVCHCFL